MALPSSPPLPPDTTFFNVPEGLLPTAYAEDDLPEIPGSLGGHLLQRKRQVTDLDLLSSDPLFSEDVSEADAADYDQSSRRHKRLFRGPWWDQRGDGTSLRRSMAKRGRMKVFDSGIWMGSDLSEDSADGFIEGREAVAGFKGGVPSTELAAEAVAQANVYASLEAGHESIDLTDLGLLSLSNQTLRPLHQLIRNPHTDHARPPTEEEFRPLTPDIQLFLSGNSLASLPSELFSLTNITVLSLRNNKLDHIPPAIGRLRNLRELNLAQNNISFLPWELLELIQVRPYRLKAILRPNPLTAPCEIVGPCRIPWSDFDADRWVGDTCTSTGLRNAASILLQKRFGEQQVQWTPRDELETRLQLGLSQIPKVPSPLSTLHREAAQLFICLASSTVCLFNVDGSPCRPQMRGNASNPRYAADLTDPMPTCSSAPDPVHSRVPSLFELALRTVQRLCATSELRSAPSTLPRSLQCALEVAASSSELGGDICSTCGKGFIIARAEWVEFWFHATGMKRELSQEAVLPFLRRACSWRCATSTTPGGMNTDRTETVVVDAAAASSYGACVE